MTRRRQPVRVVVSVVTDHTAEVRGDGAFRVLERLECPRQFQHRPPSNQGPAWTIPAQYARDVEAMAQHMGGSAEVDGQAVLLG